MPRRRACRCICHGRSVPQAAGPPSLPLYRRFFGEVRGPLRPGTAGKVETERYAFDVIETPGHAADHVVLHEPRRGWLFAGDLYLGSRVVTIMRDESLPSLMASIRRVLELDFGTLFCAHAGPVPDGKAALRAKLQLFGGAAGPGAGTGAARRRRPGGGEAAVSQSAGADRVVRRRVFAASRGALFVAAVMNRTPTAIG